MKLLVTGGSGFIGSHFIRLALKKGYRVVNLDKLTYAGNEENNTDYEKEPGYSFIKMDICDIDKDWIIDKNVSAVVNFAAESHVDRSIDSANEFLRTNTMGVQVLLDACRHKDILFLQVSTDEVYGAIRDGSADEQARLRPMNPYSASKAAADMLCLAHGNTYNTAVRITRSANNYGSHQFPEKLIPLFIRLLLDGQKVPVYGDGNQVRSWIHVVDNCRAIMAVLELGVDGQIYNIGADTEIKNIDLTREILKHLGLDDSYIEYVKDRPGHDVRYSIRWNKLNKKMGWRPRISFEDGLKETIRWYRECHQQNI